MEQSGLEKQQHTVSPQLTAASPLSAQLPSLALQSPHKISLIPP